MTSPKQIEANRRNATLSTGPKTEQGRQVSRRNALTHGLTAKQVVIEGEDPADYERLLEGLIEELSPQTVLERQLVERLAGDLWRSKRIQIVEAGIFEAHRHEVQKEHRVKSTYVPDPDRYKRMLESYGVAATPISDDHKVSGSPEESPPPEEPSAPKETPEQAELRKQKEAAKKASESILLLGRAFLRDANGYDAFGKLSRYDAILGNAIKRTIQQLYKLRQERTRESKVRSQIVDLESVKVED